MGFTEGLLIGAVLLLTCGNLHATSQIQSNFSNNDIMDLISRVNTSLQVSTSPRVTDQQRDLGHSAVRYQLRSNQLRNPALIKQKPSRPQTIQSLQASEAGEPASDQMKSREGVLAPEQLAGQVVDVSSPVEQNSKVVVKLEQRVPVSADSVVVHCGEGEVTVQVEQNFLGNGQLIHPGDLTLGGCPALYAAGHFLQFQAELHGCGSTMSMTEDSLIYTFSLKYFPTPIGNTFILKTNPAEVIIECHYQRRHYASSSAVRPAWKPFASKVLAEEQLHFSLRLLTESWQLQRASTFYNLSDMMHFEVSVHCGHHVPLRVYVDSCMATLSPNPNSQPSYAFISNHGCLTDAKLTGAKSYFMQRSQEDKLHFQLKAFRFHQDPRNSLFITCLLKATTVSVPVSSRHKACSFLTEANRWVASGGDNKVCSCCETSCSEERWKRGLPADVVEGLPPDVQWEGTASLGPILLEENMLRLNELSEHPPQSVSLLQTHLALQATSCLSMAVLCGGVAVLAVMIAFVCAIISSRFHKPIGHTVCN